MLKHEKLPDQLRNEKQLKSHLCSLACSRNSIAAEQCAQCVSPCKYGYRLLELYGMDYRKPVDNNDYLRQGQPLPTLRQRLRKRRY